MDHILGFFLVATLAIVVISTVAIVVHRNAARAKWAADFWLSRKEATRLDGARAIFRA